MNLLVHEIPPMLPRAAVAAPRKAKAPQAEATADPTARAGRVFDAGLVAVFLGLTFLLGVFPLKDTDFWWHLKAGDLIRQTGWVPTADTLTFGAEGHRWIDLHWVFQLLMSFGYERVGVVGLNVAKCLITCLAVGLLATSGRREWPTWVTLLTWLPALLVLSGRMYLRPETLTLLYLATDLAILARWDRRPWLAVGLPIVQACWVNTQGLFVFGPFLVGVALLDAATRRGAFAADRRAWWRIALPASFATGLACLANPYGFVGAFYPIELLGTMGNPIFRSIGELKPLLTLYGEVGFDLLPLRLHILTMALGALSFVIPATWRVATALRDRRTQPAPGEIEAKAKPKARKPRKAAAEPPIALESDRPLRWSRLILFLTFSGLSFSATRNSHQFAAVVGTVTAWNFAEWAAEVAARRRRLAAAPISSALPWARLATLGVLALVLVAVGSGRFYAWSQEGRTIGLGEEPLWFPHAATKFAGTPGMPDRLVGFHNGHPSLYEYEWGPTRKVYTDARLEVMGPELYTEYMALQAKVSQDQPGWAEALAKMKYPAVMVDTVDPTSGGMAATLLNARGWQCVWFDPIVALFVHASYPEITGRYAVDFLARHYGTARVDESPGHADPGWDDSARDDKPTAIAMARALRSAGTRLRFMPGGERTGLAVITLGLDCARRVRQLDPGDLDGYKQAGLLNYLRDPLPGDRPIPRFRLTFDPTIDFSLTTAAYQLIEALRIDPDEHVCLFYLAMLDTTRGMDEEALPILEHYARQPNKNVEQQRQKDRATQQATEIRRRLGPIPPTAWANLSELEQVFDRLCQQGRAATAADVVEAGHRAEARPWAWADRLATIRLHLGQPARARAIWAAATDAPPGVAAARVAATYMVEDDLDAARRNYATAIAADPKLFEAHFGLAQVEQAAGHANAAVAAARDAERTAPDAHRKAAARAIITEAAPYQQPQRAPGPH